MSDLEGYTAKAAESLAAADAATTDSDRTYHRRAHSVWQKLILGVAQAEKRAALAPEPKPKALKPTAPKSVWPRAN